MEMPENGYMVYHWGYGNEVLPCESDQTTCEYLDGVYKMHDVSMTYSFIMWGVLLGIAVVWVALRGWRMGGPSQKVGGVIDGLCDRLGRLRRRWLLKDTPLRSLFGRTTRLQVAILAIMSGYLLIFSFTGIIWKRWNNDHPSTSKTRTPLGWWSDRVGILAYALTPLTVLLATRENLLTILTGIPYQHFNFLHRWLGRIIFAQAMLHTIGWTVVEAYFYQPASVYRIFFTNMYAIFGVVATAIICFLFVFSLKPVIRWTGYEFFKVTHWVAAILYIGACWGHWDKLYCWMVASLILMFLDQGARLVRTCYLHFGGTKGIGFRRAMSEVKIIGEGDDVIVRVDFDFEQEAWEPGQHFYLCFPSLSIWQSHPFTVASMPDFSSKVQHHTYLLRARKGQTAQLAALAGQTDVPVIITGPYGPGYPKHTTDNVLAVAGGTGVTFTMPIVIASLRQMIVPQATVDFVWVIRRAQDLLWLNKEFVEFKEMLEKNPGLRISIFVTREDQPHIPFCCNRPSKQFVKDSDPEKGPTTQISSRSSETSNRATLQELLAIDQDRFSVQLLGSHHPTMPAVVTSFMERANKRGGYIQVLGSGPDAMGSDLREAIAKVEERGGLDFYWDSRE